MNRRPGLVPGDDLWAPAEAARLADRQPDDQWLANWYLDGSTIS